MPKKPTNKLSVYLIKEEYTSAEEILKNYNELESEDIENIGNFYYGDSHSSEPSWVRKFFGGSFDNSSEKNKLNIFTASSKAVLLVSVEDRLFVLAFGYGRALLNPGVCEERFGLKVALNVVDSENVRSIDKQNMSVTPKFSKEQITKDGTFADFGIDIEQDLIQGITGKSKNESFGKTVTGKDSLSVSVKVDHMDIKSFLETCYEQYNSDDYKKNFGWIDQISAIKDPTIIEEFDRKLVEKIKNEEFEKTWMAVPKIIAWEDVLEFRLKDHSFGDDIDLRTYLEFFTVEERQNLSSETLKEQRVHCISATSDIDIHSWKVYNCLYCEIENKKQVHILSNGKWYQVESSFVEEVSNSFDSLREKSAGIYLPDCKEGEYENAYNKRVAKKLPETCSMDGDLIYHGGMNQKIEFCDLFTKKGELIHVKHYGASAVLSHLFSQGLVSGELFLSDQEFRTKLNGKLPNGYKLENVEDKPKSSEYKIVFAIISKSEEDLSIPFFSKVNIKNIKRRLENLGYPVFLLKISTTN